MKDVEIEIQVQVEDIKPLKKFLAREARSTGEAHQLDEYYSPAHRNFLDKRPVAEWLRLRDANGKASITYKNWHYKPDGRSTHADEYESKIESVDQLRKIFTVLDHKLICKIDKRRKTFRFMDYEIALDSIAGLGDFVEVEYKGNDQGKKPEEITKEMFLMLKDIGVGKITRNYNGYPFIALFPDQVKYEEL